MVNLFILGHLCFFCKTEEKVEASIIEILRVNSGQLSAASNHSLDPTRFLAVTMLDSFISANIVP